MAAYRRSSARGASGLAHLAEDGSTSVAVAAADGQALVRMDLTADGLVDVLVLRESWWAEARLSAGRCSDRGTPMVFACLACSADGDVEARLRARAGDGRHWSRRLRVDSGGARRWTAEERDAAGSVGKMEGRFADGASSVSRRQFDRAGSQMWAQQDVTTFGADGRRLESTAARTPAAGLARQAVTTYGEAAPGQGGGFRVPPRGDPSRLDANQATAFYDESPSSQTTVEELPGGAKQYTTVLTAEGVDSSGTGWATTTDTAVTVFETDGSVTVTSHEVDTVFVRGDGSEGTSSEKTWVDDDGETWSESEASVVDAAGNQSTTNVVTSPDGLTTLTTTTVDSAGVGTTATTVTLPDGGVVSETTEPVGGDPGLAGSGEGDGGDGNGGDGGTEVPPFQHPCGDDGVDDYCIPIVVGAMFAERVRTLPYHVGRGLDGIQPRVGDDGPQAIPLADQVADALRRSAWMVTAGNRRLAAAPVVHLTGAAAEAVARPWASVSLDSLADPATVVSLAAATVAALARTGAFSPQALSRMALAAHRLAGPARGLAPLTEISSA